MIRLQRLVVLLCGSDPRLRRMLQYWAATCLLYVICIGLLLVQVGQGLADPGGAHRLIAFGGGGAFAFYLLIRVSARLKLAPDQLAVSQAVFSLVCGMAAYAISGPLCAAMPVPGRHGRRISFSAGLATRRNGEPFADAIHCADKALYRAKEAGRDRIALH